MFLINKLLMNVTLQKNSLVTATILVAFLFNPVAVFAQDQSKPETEICGRHAQPSELSVGPRVSGIWQYVDWVFSTPQPQRAVYQVISGPCAAQSAGASGAMIALKSGVAIQFYENGRAILNPASESMFEIDDIAVPPPPLPGARFIRADGVTGLSPGEGGQRDYVGLWQDAEGYVVAKFSVMDGRGAGPAYPLVRSRDEIRGLTYFPSPDNQSGGVSFVQLGADGVVRALGFGWDHPDAFPCLTPEQLVTHIPDGAPGPRRSDRKCG